MPYILEVGERVSDKPSDLGMAEVTGAMPGVEPRLNAFAVQFFEPRPLLRSKVAIRLLGAEDDVRSLETEPLES
jgi:hypothetical protein